MVKSQKRLNPFYTYSVYVDTVDYLADTIISDIGLDIEPIKERRTYTKNGNLYILVYVRYNSKKFSNQFKSFLEILQYNMSLFNQSTYISDCKEIFEEMNNSEIFGGNLS